MTRDARAVSQYREDGKLRHFLDTDGLSAETLLEIFDVADSLVGVSQRSVKKVPLLRGRTIVLLFFEPSTRTRTTFEIAAKRLSADVITVNVATSATRKGESLLDTIHTLQAMQTDMFVVRHADTGAAHLIASQVADHVAVVNAGDGCHAHPTQALLDMYTVRRAGLEFNNLRVAIVGDLLHSRVARSQIHALRTLGVGDIRVVGPRTLVPDSFAALGTRVVRDLREGLADVDLVMMLRLQRERMASGFLPSDREYFEQWGLTRDKLAVASKRVLVTHPGPINRGVEIDSAVADGPSSLILPQVSNGIAIRMAVLALTMQTQAKRSRSRR